MAEGSLFGEAALLDGGPRSATAQAVETTTVYELTRTALDEISRIEPAIAIKLMTNLARLMALPHARNKRDPARARRLARLTPVTTPVPGRRAPR